MTTTIRIPACTVDWCAHPTDPDYHVCIVCQAPAVQHAHVESRSHNPSRRKDKSNQVMLCVPHHQEVDLRQNGTRGHAIRQIPGRGRLYFRFDLHGNTIFQKILEPQPSASGAQSFDRAEPISDVSSLELGERSALSKGAGGEASAEGQPEAAKPPAPLIGESEESQSSPEGKGEFSITAPRPSLSPSLAENCQDGMRLLYWGLKLKGASDDWRWEIGDWLNRMEEEAGESAYQYFEPLKEAFGYDALRQYKSVAERVTRVTRIPELPWSTHRAVAALPEKAQRAALLTAKGEGLTSREVAVLVRPEQPEREKHDCPTCGFSHWAVVESEWRA